jgi:DNA modification methylase
VHKRKRADEATSAAARSGAADRVVDIDADACPHVELIHGDCRDVMPALPAGAFDGCVCDPPYGLGIAGWDREVPGVDVWREVLRLLKPGAALAACSARRLYDVLGSRVREAGFLVKDQAIWVFRGGRAPSCGHLLPAHEPILLARAPGRPLAINADEARIPWASEEDRRRASRIDPLRAAGRRRAVYDKSLNGYGREPFVANKLGRYPTTVMATDDVLGDLSYVFRVPKVRDAKAHVCAKPLELMVHLVKAFVPAGGVVLDPFAGSGPVGEAARITGRKAVLIELAKAA